MYNDELQHFGVKGMKWGVRKKYYNKDGSLNTSGKQRQLKKDYKTAKKSASNRAERKALKKQYESDFEKTYNKKYDVTTRAIDIHNYGRKGVNRINDRMNAGQSYQKASAIEYGRATAKGIAITAAMLAAPAIADATVGSIRKYVNQRAIQRANSGLARIGTLQYEKVAKNIYRQVMK